MTPGARVCRSRSVRLISAPTHFGQPSVDESFLDPPIGVLTLATLLRSTPWECEVFDSDRLYRQFVRAGESSGSFCTHAADVLCARDTAVFALGSICSSYPFTLRLAGEIKRRQPDAIVVLGGPQASVVDRATLEAFPAVDFIIRGEADETFPRWLDALAGNEDPYALPGLTYRRHGGVIRNPNAPAIADLDVLPLPAFDLCTDVSDWPHLVLELGRGCPFACEFCSTNDFFRRRFRLKSPSVVLRQMQDLCMRYGSKHFVLVHDMFTVDRQRVVEFCEAMPRGDARIFWSCSARTDCVDIDLLDQMRDAGCAGIFFGIETGSPRMQKIVGKNLDIAEARCVLEAADDREIPTTFSLIVGYPEETKADFRETVNFFADGIRLDHADAQMHRLAPLAETPLTTRYQSRLVLDDGYSDMSGSVIAHESPDRELIAAHPSIFPNFYALPCSLPADYLLGIREFLLTGFQQAKGLLAALHQESGDLLEIGEAWLRRRARGAYLDELLALVREGFGERGWAASEVMCRYYEALREFDRRRLVPFAGLVEQDEPATGDTIPMLAEDTRVVRVDGDVIRVLQSLRRAQPVPPEALHRRVTVIVSADSDGRSRVGELSELQALILASCDGRNCLGQIAEKLAACSPLPGGMTPARFCPAALDALRAKHVVRYVRPAANALDQVQVHESVA